MRGSITVPITLMTGFHQGSKSVVSLTQGVQQISYTTIHTICSTTYSTDGSTFQRSCQIEAEPKTRESYNLLFYCKEVQKVNLSILNLITTSSIKYREHEPQKNAFVTATIDNTE